MRLSWRLPYSYLTRQFTVHSVSKASQPLKIAFFGSDEFSIRSLEKLLDYKNTNPSRISHIDLIARHSKPTGRGLAVLSELPITKYAEGRVDIKRAELKQEIIELSENKYDLAIAVSYGKLIPSEFIKQLKYGGLNVHPSLLPRHSGASPLQYALLENDSISGATVQTLHPTKFDKGKILLQKELPIAPDETLASLRDKLAVIGGDLLVEVIDQELYRGEGVQPKYEYSYAKKITPDMKKIDWSFTSDQLVRRCHVLGSLYGMKQVEKKKKLSERRVILYDVKKADYYLEGEVGLFSECDEGVMFKTIDGTIVTNRLKFECFGEEDGATFMKKLPKRVGKVREAVLH